MQSPANEPVPGWLPLIYLLPVFLAVVLITDSLTRLGFAHGALYVPLVFLAALSKQERTVLLVAATAVLFTILGFMISPPAPEGFSMAYVLANRAFAIVSIAISAVLSIAAIRYMVRLELANRELMEARTSLEESAGMLKIASDINHLGGWVLDVASRQVICSAEITAIYGANLGKSIDVELAFGMYAVEDRPVVRELFRRCIEENTAFDSEFRIQLPDGCQRWIRLTGRPVVDDTGRVARVQGAVQDITSWRETRESLIQSQERFRELTDAMPMIVWMANRGFVPDFYNRAFYEYTGLPPGQPPEEQASIDSLLHPDDRGKIGLAMGEADRQNRPFSVDVRFRRQDGEYRWHLVRGEPIAGTAGELVRWYGVMLDIDGSKRQAETYRKLADRLNNTLESITDGFFMLDKDWRFTFVNTHGEQLMGMKREKLLGRVLWEVFPTLADTRFGKEYRRAVEEKITVRFESFFPPLDMWVNIRVYPSEEGLALYFQDVSERRNLEERLHQSQRLEAVGHLTGGIAHDFNNLLTVILGNGEVLRESLTEDPYLQNLADMVVSASQRGAALTQHLLAFARRQALEPQIVDVNNLVRDLDGLLRRTLGADIDIEWVRAPGVWPALVDPAQLESALLNLTLNARDAMPGGGRLTIETANVRINEEYALQHQEVKPGQYVLIAVSDTGKGIPKADLQRVFEPFYTTKGKEKGTGLGLSMVYGFVKQSEGHISIYSEENEGTTVKLYLPRASARAASEDTGKDIIAAAAPGGETILLVEDDDLVRHFAMEQLGKQGYRVIAAAHGQEALALLEAEQKIDLLFTDVVMPGGMNGRELAEKVMARYPAVKVLYTSGYTENAIVHHGRLDPGTQLLAKPYRRADLLKKIQQTLLGYS